MPYCYYYQATVRKTDAWFLVAILRSFEHLAFDRTLEKNSSRFEFFVPHDLEKYFLKLMSYFQKEGIVTHFEQLPNRLEAGNKF
jgi:hypothetical protein